jgi:NAD-dependent dihydropyrimidine dehydrogenase PreA subunit
VSSSIAAQRSAARPRRSVVFAPLYPRSERRRNRFSTMAYVIAEPCIGTKDNSCVEVCPVDCIHPTPDEPDYDKVEMLYIDPEECIDCDACVEACPVDACFAEDQLPEEWQKYAQINADYYANR